MLIALLFAVFTTKNVQSLTLPSDDPGLMFSSTSEVYICLNVPGDIYVS